MGNNGTRGARATTRSMSFKTRPSPYNVSVTIYEPEDIEGLASSSSAAQPPVTTERQTRRIKAEKNHDSEVSTSFISGSSSLKDHRKLDASSPRKVIKVKRATTSPVKKQKAKPIPQTLASPHPAPENWREVYDTIKQMRSHITAPVDTMGCDQAQYKESDPRNRRFATLVSLMLSSQTKDEVTDAAITNLRAAVGGALSVEAIVAADESTIAGAISKVGFWRRKTGYLKNTAELLRNNFASDVPKTVDELCSLPGVGPKMAFLTLQVAWNLNHGIGVDVHVHRITNRLGWHKKPTKTPEETRLNLQSWLPTEFHREINHLLVGFGQVVCLPVGPRCDQCKLSTKGLCPSAQNVVKSTKRKTIAGLLQQDSPSKIKVELEANDARFPDPSIDQETMAQLEVMPKEEEEGCLQVWKREEALGKLY